MKTSETPSESRQYFYALGEGGFIPSEIGFYNGHFQPQRDNLDQWRSITALQVKDFVEWAPSYLQEVLFYVPYCEKEGLMVDSIVQTPIGEIKVKKPQIPFREQAYENLVGDLRWQNFMATYTPSREALLTAAKQVIGRIPRRDTRYIDLFDVKQFDESMQTGGYKIALALIPDLTDSEVKRIFGRSTSLEEIKRRAARQQEDTVGTPEHGSNGKNPSTPEGGTKSKRLSDQGRKP